MSQQSQSSLPSTLTSRALVWRLSLDQYYLEDSSFDDVEQVLTEFKQQKLNPMSFAAQYAQKKYEVGRLWKYVLSQNTLETRSHSYLKGLWQSFNDYEHHAKWNHFRKDSLVELGLYLKELTSSS